MSLAGLLLWGMLISALLPVVLTLLYGARTGRLLALFSKSKADEAWGPGSGVSPVLRRVCVACVPVFFVCLGGFVFLSA